MPLDLTVFEFEPQNLLIKLNRHVDINYLIHLTALRNISFINTCWYHNLKYWLNLCHYTS